MDLALWQIIVLAVVQGIAEFLPISSSGHLVVVASWFASQANGESVANLDVADLNIVLHAGTLLSILVFYWRRVVWLLGEDRRVIGLLIVGTIPAVIVGLTIKQYFEHWLSNPILAGAMLFVTGGVLLWSGRVEHNKEATYRQMSFVHALMIGLSQALAILPGISRSGLTICTGLGLGLRRESAATFSFLLAIPAIAGASVLEMKDLATETTMSTPIGHLLAGAVVAFVVGLMSLWWLIRWLEQGHLSWFAYWCFVVGTVVLVWQLWPAGGG